MNALQFSHFSQILFNRCCFSLSRSLFLSFSHSHSLLLHLHWLHFGIGSFRMPEIDFSSTTPRICVPCLIDRCLFWVSIVIARCLFCKSIFLMDFMSLFLHNLYKIKGSFVVNLCCLLKSFFLIPFLIIILAFQCVRVYVCMCVGP